MPAVDSLKCFLIADRTDSAGTSQGDVDQEELRMLVGLLLAEGITPNLNDQSPNPDAFNVRQDTGSNMQLKVGSGDSKGDGLVLKGTVDGQGSYLLRLDATSTTITVPAADTTNPANYGVYAFVDDASYGGTPSRRYAGISCLRGTPAGSPSTPGPDAAWSAHVLLWEFQLPANATAVTDAILDAGTDRRSPTAPAVGVKRAGATVTTSQTGFSTEADVNGLSVTFDTLAGHEYLIVAKLPIVQKTSQGTPFLDLTDGSNTQLDRWQRGAIPINEICTATLYTPYSPGAGEATVKLRLTTNTATVDTAATSTTPGFIRVLDIGLA